MPPATHWLLLRGLSHDQRHWGKFPDTFAARLGCTVTCLDAPGFGTEHLRTSPRSIAAITDDIRSRFDRDGKRWSILAISLGAMIALDWCARYPGDFDNAVIINTSTRATAAHRRFNPALLPALAASRLRKDPQLAHERAVLARVANHPPVDRDELAQQWVGYLRDQPSSGRSLLNQSIAAMRFDLPAHIDVPALVLNSRHDRVVHNSASHTIATRLGAPVRIHDTAGHDLTLDDAPWVCDQVRAWLNRSTCGGQHGA